MSNRTSTDVVKIYEPRSRARIGLFKSWFIMFRNIYVSSELIAQLFKRDFLASYKKSFLGMSWIIIAPIAGIVSWVFMNATGILKPGDVGIPYPAYVLLSTSIWGLFMGFYSSAEGGLRSGSSLIMQVSFPHEVLLVKQVSQHLANYSLGFILNIVVLLLFGVTPSWMIILFPVLALPLFFLGAGIGLVVSVFSMVAAEAQRIVGLFLSLLMFVTPVIYSDKVQNELLQNIINWNPLTYLIGTTRDIIVYGHSDAWQGYILSTIFSIIVFLISWRLFFLSEEKVVERMM